MLFLSLVASLLMSSVDTHAQQLAFPGADGYGKHVTGGRGGEVCYVTRLDDCPDNNLVPGTFRWAVRHDNGGRPRTILFNVSGTIYLTSVLKMQYPDVSILGQSAPGGGICLAGYNFYISKNNVIVRYIRFRAGDIPNTSMTGLDMENADNVIIDHCSLTWSMEECLTAYDTDYTTVQWCIIGEGLYYSKNSKGPRAYAMQWGGEHSTMHHTLITNSHSRSPRFNGVRSASTNKGDHDYKVDSEFANNVVYNWSTYGSPYGGEYDKAKVEVPAWTKSDPGYNRVYLINNYYRPGPSTKNGTQNARYWIAPSSPYGEWYLSGNKFETSSKWAPSTTVWSDTELEKVNADNLYGTVSANSSRGINLTGDNASAYIMTAMPYALSGLEYESADQAYSKVVTQAGASLPRYDEVDRRLLDEAAGKTDPRFVGTSLPSDLGIIDTPDNVTLQTTDSYLADGKLYSNYPFLGMLPGDKYAIDSDGDGMPDAYETAKGLNPNDSADGTTVTASGYTNLENYLNGIADGTINKADYETSPYPVTPGQAPQTTVSITCATQTLTAAYGQAVTLPTTVGDKTYSSWTANGMVYTAGEEYVFTSDITLEGLVTITFSYDYIQPITVKPGVACTLPTLSRDGYTFMGWSDGSQVVMEISPVTCMRLVPVFKELEGPSGSGVATVTWPFKGTQDVKGTQDPTGVFDVATSAVGSAFTTMKKTQWSMDFFALQPAVQISDRDEDNCIELYLQPTSGVTFKPTNLSFLAARFGTDGGKVDVTMRIGDGEETTLLEGLNPNRNNKADEPSSVSLDIDGVEATGGPIVFRIYLYSLGNTKQVGYHNIVLTGNWEGTAKPATKYMFTAEASPAEGGTVTQSPAGTEFIEDTKISLSAKPASDYVFVNWTDADGNIVSKNQNISVTLTRDLAYKANFRAIASYTDIFKEGSPYDAECRDGQELLIALKAAALTTKSRYRIFLHDGDYDLGNLCLTNVSKNVSLIGESQDGVVISNTPEAEGIGVTATLYIEKNVSGIYMQDLTLLNRLDYGASSLAGRAVCLQDKGTKNAYKNVALLSNQDTYYANNGSQKAYWETSKITGTVDFICGDGSVFFERCQLYVNKRDNGNVICAPNTQAGAAYWGFVFNSCTVDGDAPTQAGRFSLGRPWNDSPHCTYLNTRFNILPQDAGWANMSADKVVRFHEYGSTDKDGTLLDLSKRSLAACSPAEGSDPCVISEETAASYTVDAVLGTDWQPQLLCRQLDAPQPQASGSMLTWPAVDGAYCYAVCKGGKVVAFTTETSFDTAGDGGEYSIRVANEMGGLSPQSPSVTTAISHIVADDSATDAPRYNVSGQRVGQSAHGIIIQNGRKTVRK